MVFSEEDEVSGDIVKVYLTTPLQMMLIAACIININYNIILFSRSINLQNPSGYYEKYSLFILK